MTPTPGPEDRSPAAAMTRFSGREAFALELRQAMVRATLDGARELIFSDPDFLDWPLGSRDVLEQLSAWAGTGRTLTLLAASYDGLIRWHPRFVAWRVLWDHIITCRRLGSLREGPENAGVPSVLWQPSCAVERQRLGECVGVVTADRHRLLALHQRLTEALKVGAPAFPASVTGL